MPREPVSSARAALTMTGIGIALFFLPLLNGLIAGLTGGYRLADTNRAVLTALIPAVIVAGVQWLLFGLLVIPVLGLFIGIPVAVLAVFGMLAGAAAGGVLGARSLREPGAPLA